MECPAVDPSRLLVSQIATSQSKRTKRMFKEKEEENTVKKAMEEKEKGKEKMKSGF
jgi:hypothetical protein